jgi:hypothetical protein
LLSVENGEVANANVGNWHSIALQFLHPNFKGMIGFLNFVVTVAAIKEDTRQLLIHS